MKRFAALLLLLLACGRDETVVWHEEAGYRWRALTVGGGEAGFTAQPGSRTGVRFQNDVSDSLLVGNRMLGQGAGIALGDVDGDGRVDVFLARTEGCSGLYRNLGNWKFEDITRTAGVGACGRHSTGATLADIDGDDDLDLLLLATTGPNAAFLNDGHGVFTERRDLGIDSTAHGGTTMTLSDVDGSGHLSLYIANYKPYNIDDSLPPQRRAFAQMVRQVAPGTYEIVPEHQRDYKVVLRPELGGVRMSQRAHEDEFYSNDGKGRFTRVPFTGGRFSDADGRPITDVAESFALGAKFADLNGDGAPELFVTNDFEDPDALWFNDGRGGFRLADWRSLRQLSNSSMGVDVADVNGDGRPDIFVTDMLANDSKRVKTQIPTHTAFAKKPGDMESQLQYQRNSLFVNRGDGSFGELSMYAGVQASGWSWGTMFSDVDLDGWPDVLIANGHLWDVMDADVQEGLQNRLNAIQWQRLRWQFPPLKLRNVAFRNRGDLTFEDAGTRWSFGTEEDISHAIAQGDLDDDGDLDVVVNRLGAPALLLRTQTSAPRVSVRLRGRAPNTRAVGAKVRLLNGAVAEQTREVTAGGLYMSHSDYGQSFAMGKSDGATIVVDWRDGTQTTIRDVRANRHYEISQASASATPPAARPPAADTARTLFEDVSSQLAGHRHAENVFDDWDRQFLLPDALSQLGPGVAWFDLDRDGREDLLVGSGKGGSLGVFHNEGRVLRPQPAGGPVATLDHGGVVGVADAAGARVLVGSSTWESRSDAERIAQPSVLRFAGTARGVAAMPAAIPSHESSTGGISVADYDGDGALDLFVGSRALPMQYPVAVSSGLFRSVNGAFVLDTVNSAKLRGIGLVSSSMFADVTGDGYPELLLAREWGSIALFINDGRGGYTPAPASWGLDSLTSRWIGLAAGDLDGDGRLDLVATSWGRNVATPADSVDPLTLVYGPFGARGEVEMLLARRATGVNATRVNGMTPFNSYARVRIAVPHVASRVSSFSAYADADVSRLLGSIPAVQQLSARTLDHTLFLNRGGRFERVSLPAEAQWAPAFYAGIADFDGDGMEDVFLSQNFSPTTVGVPRYDAGRSLLLSGDGRGGLTPVSGAASGLHVYGDGRGAGYSDFDADGRLDLAVAQNGGVTRLFRNRGAKPGLRIRLIGSRANPDAVGAQVRVAYGARLGPAREIQSGAGYWSQNGAVQVFGLSGVPSAVWVRWPGGGESRNVVPAGATEVTVRR